MEVVGEAGDGEESIKLAKELHPQVVVMDCALPGMNGLEATRQIIEDSPDTAVLMLSMHTESTWVRQAIEAGAKGYVLKNAMDLELGAAIRKVAAGETVFDPQVEQRIGSEGRAQRRAHAAGTGSVADDRRRQVEQGDCDRARSQRQHCRGSPREHHELAGNSQDRGVGGIRDSRRAGERSVNRRSFPWGNGGTGVVVAAASLAGSDGAGGSLGFSGLSIHRCDQLRRESSSSTTAEPSAASSCPKLSGPAALSSTTIATAGRTFC